MPRTTPNPQPNPAPFIDVVNAKLPGQVARMRADTVRGSWKPRAKDDKEAAAEAGTAPAPTRARKGAKRAAARGTNVPDSTTATKAASGSATATAPTTEGK
jgi:hypothetical protein